MPRNPTDRFTAAQLLVGGLSNIFVLIINSGLLLFAVLHCLICSFFTLQTHPFLACLAGQNSELNYTAASPDLDSSSSPKPTSVSRSIEYNDTQRTSLASTSATFSPESHNVLVVNDVAPALDFWPRIRTAIAGCEQELTPLQLARIEQAVSNAKLGGK